MKTKAIEEGFLGEFTLDPTTEEFKNLRGVCEPGNPWRCLIATTGSIHLRLRMTVRVDHDEGTGVIGVTKGGLRYERPMTPEEIVFATRFDFGMGMRKSLTVRIDLSEPEWKSKKKKPTVKQKNASERTKTRNGDRRIHTVRARQLKAIKEKYATV